VHNFNFQCHSEPEFRIVFLLVTDTQKKFSLRTWCLLWAFKRDRLLLAHVKCPSDDKWWNSWPLVKVLHVFLPWLDDVEEGISKQIFDLLDNWPRRHTGNIAVAKQCLAWTIPHRSNLK